MAVEIAADTATPVVAGRASGRAPRAASTRQSDAAPVPADDRPLPPPTTAARATVRPTVVRWLIAAVAATAGLAATIDGAAPTGDPAVDRILVAVAVGGITWLGAAALRWDAAVVTLLAGILTATWIGAAIGVVVAGVGFAVPVRPGLRGLLNAALIGVALNLAAHSQLGVFLGLSTIVAVALGLYVGAIGFLRRSKRTRRLVAGTLGAATALAFVAAFALAVVGYLAADDLRAGNDRTQQGLASLRSGDLPAARVAFAAAADAFEAADHRIDIPLTAPARYVPGLAQHHRVATELTDDAADAARFIALELERIDLDGLSTSEGRIDIDRVRALQSPLLAIEQRIGALQLSLAELDDPWLAPPVADRLDRLAADVAEQHRRSDDALTAAIAAPALLGGDGPRTYFVGFTTPSEARGSGGFMGNWAEVTVIDGHIEMTRFGRADDLNAGGDPTTRRIPTGEGFDPWLARYGPYNLSNGPGGTTGEEPWKNLNMSPDMTMTGRAIAALYPQSGGGELDGVFVMDVYSLARILRFTGPIGLPEGFAVDGQPYVTTDNAAAFLLHGQYRVTEVDTRVDVLEDFSRAVVDTLLSQRLPPPHELLDALGPMVDQGRITGWMARPDEQAVLAQVGLAGTLADPGDDDGLAIVFNNAAGNKIDYFLAADATYRVEADARTGHATATLTLTMTNNAPAEGEPGYVIGSPIGLPPGTNRTWVSLFTQLPVTSIRLDGGPIESEPSAEAGYFVTSAFVTLPPGATSTLTVEMTGPLDVLEQYELAVRTPPTVAPTQLTIDATWTDAGGTARREQRVVADPGAERLVLAP